MSQATSGAGGETPGSHRPAGVAGLGRGWGRRMAFRPGRRGWRGGGGGPTPPMGGGGGGGAPGVGGGGGGVGGSIAMGDNGGGRGDAVFPPVSGRGWPRPSTTLLRS